MTGKRLEATRQLGKAATGGVTLVGRQTGEELRLMVADQERLRRKVPVRNL